MENIQDIIAEHIVEITCNMTMQKSDYELHNIFASCTEKLDANPNFLQYLLSNDTGFFDRITQKLTERIADRFISAAPNTDRSLIMNTLSFLHCGMFGAYRRWLSTRDCSIDEFCSHIISVIDFGTDQFMRKAN